MGHAARKFTDQFPPRGMILAHKYRVEEQIAEGGMGVVMRATHLELDAPVAIKLIRSDLAHKEIFVERMLAEARAVARLKNEHDVRVLDVARLPSGVPYLVMEYLEGEDLYDVLRQRGRLDAATAIDYVLQACEALAEAHAAGIVHRDLKPENLYLTAMPDGMQIIKVLDFGVSKRLDDDGRDSHSTNPSTAVGSPHYMAPEQMRAAPDVDERADIWSLGAILFELLTGHPPFDAETISGICVQVLEDDPPKLRDVLPGASGHLEAVIDVCLDKDPGRRFADVVSLANALALVGGAPEDRAARVRRWAAAGARQTPVSAVRRIVRRSSGPGPAPRARAIGPSVAAERRASRPDARRRSGRRRSLAVGLVTIGLLAAAPLLEPYLSAPALLCTPAPEPTAQRLDGLWIARSQVRLTDVGVDATPPAGAGEASNVRLIR